jgi:hypothetical protein
MRKPLLRSTGVLGGLFYDFVIVTEADSDRAFYQEINERLLRFEPTLGIPNCMFIHAQNKQTVRTIIKPLREMGIPAAGIVDLDVIKDGGADWTQLLNALHTPLLELRYLGQARAELLAQFEGSGRNMKRDGGTALLSDGDREAANNLFDRLGQYGLFVVRAGELESWLADLGITGHGSNWLVAMFERMGENPASSDYIIPAKSDVWAFLGEIKSWLADPLRRGIPS